MSDTPTTNEPKKPTVRELIKALAEQTDLTVEVEGTAVFLEPVSAADWFGRRPNDVEAFRVVDETGFELGRPAELAVFQIKTEQRLRKDAQIFFVIREEEYKGELGGSLTLFDNMIDTKRDQNPHTRLHGEDDARFIRELIYRHKQFFGPATEDLQAVIKPHLKWYLTDPLFLTTQTQV